MKLGLLTYNHAVNIGSVLQTYCAWRLLSDLFPRANVEIIDYYSAILQRHNAAVRFQKSLTHASTRQWLLLEWNYRRFLTRRCRFSKASILTDAIDVGIRTIASQKYDAVFVGSDTVFQLGGYAGQLLAAPKAPNLYFLPGLVNTRKIGLAVSFDPVERWNDALKDLDSVRPHILNFDRIFYRDETSARLLREAGIDEGRIGYVPDPTIMVDITHLADFPAADKTWPLKRAGISIADPEIKRSLERCLIDVGYSVVDIMQPPRQETFDLRSDPIGKRIAIYRSLDLVVTDRFHGSILALQLGDCNIVGIEDAGLYKEPISKVRDMYSRLGLESRILRCSKEDINLERFRELIAKKTWTRPEIISGFARLRAAGFDALSSIYKTD